MAGPAKPRAALGEIRNITANGKEAQKKVIPSLRNVKYGVLNGNVFGFYTIWLQRLIYFLVKWVGHRSAFLARARNGVFRGHYWFLKKKKKKKTFSQLPLYVVKI